MSGTPLIGIPGGIVSSGNFVGGYYNPANNYASTSYYGLKHAYVSDISLPISAAETKGRGLSESGEVVGFYYPPNSNVASGFALQNNTVTTFNDPHPNAVNGTFLEGVNKNGVITGFWQDKVGNPHAFALVPDFSTVYEIQIPNSTYSQSFGVQQREPDCCHFGCGDIHLLRQPSASGAEMHADRELRLGRGGGNPCSGGRHRTVSLPRRLHHLPPGIERDQQARHSGAGPRTCGASSRYSASLISLRFRRRIASGAEGVHIRDWRAPPARGFSSHFFEISASAGHWVAVHGTGELVKAARAICRFRESRLPQLLKCVRMIARQWNFAMGMNDSIARAVTSEKLLAVYAIWKAWRPAELVHGARKSRQRNCAAPYPGHL